jgi:anti-sigma regulatory factor (Ser/Thr protein kinase)
MSFHSRRCRTPRIGHAATRRHTEEVLCRWRLDADAAFVYRAQLVVSELVTNAAIAGGTLSADERDRYHHHHPMSLTYQRLAALGQVLLRLSSDGSAYVLVEVGDQNDAPPAPRIPDTECEDGRGLFLVESLCDGMGWYPTTGPDDGACKIVWSRLRLS